MTNKERWDYYDSGEIQQESAIDLLDWVGYWTSAGTAGKTALNAAQMEMAISMILDDLGSFNMKVAKLVIATDTIKNAEAGSVTSTMIKTAVTNIMANKLAWLTGIKEVAESE